MSNKTKHKLMEHVQVEVRVVSIYVEPGTGEKVEGTIMRFGIHPSQLHELEVSYSI